MNYEHVKLKEVLTESKIVSTESNPDKRITVKLNVKGVEKRPLVNEKGNGTKYYVRKAGQFIYGKQNLFKGAFGIVPIELNGFESSSDLPAFDVNNEICNPEWIVYYFRTNEYYKTFESLSTGTGSKRVQVSKFLEISIPLPERDIQDMIILKIKHQEGIIKGIYNNLEKKADLLSELRYSILSDAVQGNLTYQDTNTESAQSLLQNLKKAKEFFIKNNNYKNEKASVPINETEFQYDIPENWVWCRLEDISYVGTGSTPLKSNKLYYSNGTTPWITSSATGTDFVESAENYISELAVKEHRLKIYPVGTLVVALYGQGKTRGQITELKIEATTNQACACIVPTSEEFQIKDYLKIYFKKIYNEIRQLAEGGAQPNLNVKKIKSYLIPLPPIEEQIRIIEKVKSLLEYCEKFEQDKKIIEVTMQMLYEQLLQEAFTLDEEADFKVG
jgi:type I restriction enzyme S subunit